MKPLNSIYRDADYGASDMNQNYGMANYAAKKPNQKSYQNKIAAFKTSPWGKSFLEKNKKLSGFIGTI